MPRLTRREFSRSALQTAVRTVLLGTVVTTTASGCGTLMYPERKHQKHSRKINWKVFTLDLVGVVLFLGLGIIAMMIDFSNGTMYLPNGHASLDTLPPGTKRVQLNPGEPEMYAVTLPKEQRTQENYEAIASTYFGQPVHLDSRQFQTRRLGRLRDFFPEAKKALGKSPFDSRSVA